MYRDYQNSQIQCLEKRLQFWVMRGGRSCGEWMKKRRNSVPTLCCTLSVRVSRWVLHFCNFSSEHHAQLIFIPQFIIPFPDQEFLSFFKSICLNMTIQFYSLNIKDVFWFQEQDTWAFSFGSANHLQTKWLFFRKNSVVTKYIVILLLFSRPNVLFN